jgi:eukaryotic-like serine/threonine-protein kinase
VVTGTVQASGNRVRVSARLIDVDNGVQLWSDRFDSGMEDLFELQEIVSQQIADALRVELDTAAHRFRASAQAIDLYLRARRDLGAPGAPRAVEAVALLDQSLDMAPDFAPALAAHAIGCVRAWWADMMNAEAAAWRERARQSVERALTRAPELAETQLAHGMYALQIGDLVTTASALALALQIAPTLPVAHRYLGELQTEAGRVDEGMRRLKLAYELDPNLDICLAAMARVAALRGDDAAYARLLGDYVARRGENLPVVLLRIRVASWRGDEEALRAFARRESILPIGPNAFTVAYVHFLLGDGDPASVLDHLEGVRRYGNQRLVGVVAQISSEGLALRGFVDEAFLTLEEAANTTLVDLDWLDRCPALASRRHDPRFAPVVSRVKERAMAIWSVR